MLKQRQRQLLRQPAHLPEGLAAVESERAAGIGRGELLQAGVLQPAPPPQLAYVGIPSPRGEVSLRSKPGGGLCVGGSPIAPPGSAFSRAALPIKGRDGVCY